ncbi:hypothetical protein L6452_34439 [Arctium lappa]|uniref:Uncharacterized protein n=1 Tax=Arctium lappa TaxID=4217 RepID=A0ACB8YI67_ARCLA|nr:hypothetical protein L6452_34439 [Arctium lappa]
MGLPWIGETIEFYNAQRTNQPRSTSGIQALCSLHIALEKTKNLLQHCAECSKLYLANSKELQLMYDPIIIASGQTYERICIEKWFSSGHNTCPKSQQQLAHLCLTPNYCVKGLIASWCELNGIFVPEGPPDSLDLNYWNLSLLENELTNSRSAESIGSCKFEREGDELEVVPEHEGNIVERYEDFLTILDMDDETKKLKSCRADTTFVKGR